MREMNAMSRFRCCSAAGLFGLAGLAQGQEPFVSGSDESDGALTVGGGTSRTITIPPDGRMNYTTISLGRNSNLYFVRNSANTPVYLLAQGGISLGGYI